jgi:hypothetical protein
VANFDVLKATGFLNEGALSGSRQSHDSDDYRGLDDIAGSFDKVEVRHCNCATGCSCGNNPPLETAKVEARNSS